MAGIVMKASYTERREGDRVEFSRGINVQLVAMDGTWQKSCVMWDVSASGAKLSVANSVEGLRLKEFFLVLSNSGRAFRRCELAWVSGEHLGVRFLKNEGQPKGRTPLGQVGADSK